jgi:hypothetical protein
MAKIYYEQDADLNALKGKTLAVLGYGNQGRNQALNLKDSGIKVVIGTRSDKTKAQAKADGFEAFDSKEAAAKADIVQILIQDDLQGSLYKNDVLPSLKSGKALMFSHGFNIHFGQIVPPADVDVFMIAPKGPGHLVRTTYVEGKGVPALVAIHQNATGNALKLALAYGKAIGATRAGVLETTFKEETETDLFGEQVVLCGGLSELIRAGFRDPGGRRLPARSGLFRVSARGEADRGPDLREGHHGHAGWPSPPPPSMATSPGAAASSRSNTRTKCSRILSRDPNGHVRPGIRAGKPGQPPGLQFGVEARFRAHRSRRWANRCAACSAG